MVGSGEVLGIFESAIDVLLHELTFLVHALQIILVTVIWPRFGAILNQLVQHLDGIWNLSHFNFTINKLKMYSLVHHRIEFGARLNLRGIFVITNILHVCGELRMTMLEKVKHLEIEHNGIRPLAELEIAIGDVLQQTSLEVFLF